MTTDIDALKRSTKILMFDQYGTVVDMQSGLIEVATPFLQKKGWNGRPDAFITWWRRTHFENSMIDALLEREHIPYRRIGEISVGYTLERAGIAHSRGEPRKRTPGADGIEQDAALDATPRGTRDGVRNTPARGIVGKDVGKQMDVMRGGIDIGDEPVERGQDETHHGACPRHQHRQDRARHHRWPGRAAWL